MGKKTYAGANAQFAPVHVMKPRNLTIVLGGAELDLAERLAQHTGTGGVASLVRTLLVAAAARHGLSYR